MMGPRPRHVSIIQAAPLFVADDIAQLTRLENERDMLKSRIKRLRPSAHARIILEHQLTRTVAEIIRLELKLHGSAR
jgi:AICAR transformylase/IMP cyclohydrolase PurH